MVVAARRPSRTVGKVNGTSSLKSPSLSSTAAVPTRTLLRLRPRQLHAATLLMLLRRLLLLLVMVVEVLCKPSLRAAPCLVNPTSASLAVKSRVSSTLELLTSKWVSWWLRGRVQKRAC
jgi:hypothetical protein